MKTNEHEYEWRPNRKYPLFNSLNEDEKLDYALSTGIEMLKQKTGRYIIPKGILEDPLHIKTSEFFHIMKENDFVNLNARFNIIMKKFMALVVEKTSNLQFNIEDLNRILIKLNNYSKKLESVTEALEYSEMNCEIMIKDFQKIPSMKGVEIPKAHIPSIIFVDILNSGGDNNPVGNSSLVIAKIKNVKIGNEEYKDETYCYSFYHSSPFLELCNNKNEMLVDLLYSLDNGFNLMDLPFQYNKHTKYRIIDKTENEHFCDVCFMNQGNCRGKSLLKKGHMIDKNENRLNYSFFTDFSKVQCNEFFNFDEEEEKRPTIDGLYNLARYILYMYATKNREIEELSLPSETTKHKIHEVRDNHQKLPKIKSLEKWHDLPIIKITKYKGNECDCLIHEIKGTHASPIPHERSGHWRHLKNGKVIWVRKCKVNCKDKDDKVLKPIYKIDGSGKVN